MKRNTDTVQLTVYLDRKVSDYLRSRGSRSGEIARIVTEAYKRERLEAIMADKKEQMESLMKL